VADDTKQRLLLATIACIERKGLQATTSRDIAHEAEANVAAVNYHFGSKRKLVEGAMQLTIDNGMEDFAAALQDERQPLAERLHRFFVALLVGGSRYPNIARAHLYGSIIDGEAPGAYLQRLSALLDRALEAIPSAELPHPRQELARRLELCMGAAMMQVIAPDMIRVTPAGAAGVHEDARRLVHLALAP